MSSSGNSESVILLINHWRYHKVTSESHSSIRRGVLAVVKLELRFEFCSFSYQRRGMMSLFQQMQNVLLICSFR